MRIAERGKAETWGDAALEKAARCEGAFAVAPANTLLRSEVSRSIATKFRVGAKHLLLLDWPKTSGTPPVLGLRSRSIRKDIIGHAFRIDAGFSTRKGFREVAGAFALLQKQPRHRGVGVIRHPLVQQGGDLFAQIGGIGKARKLEALKRVLRGGQKEVPRGLVGARSHDNLRYFIAAHNNG